MIKIGYFVQEAQKFLPTVNFNFFPEKINKGNYLHVVIPTIGGLTFILMGFGAYRFYKHLYRKSHQHMRVFFNLQPTIYASQVSSKKNQE
ncbi:MAG: hypothetical protein L0207_03420 [Chlamydiae bacterium]|nr:hypothetical protein [Chlamydiota bacterium]